MFRPCINHYAFPSPPKHQKYNKTFKEMTRTLNYYYQKPKKQIGTNQIKQGKHYKLYYYFIQPQIYTKEQKLVQWQQICQGLALQPTQNIDKNTIEYILANQCKEQDNELEQVKDKYCILYVHANAETIENIYYILKRYSQLLQLPILAFDWPGCGESEGNSTEKNLKLSTSLFIRFLTDQGYNIILWSRSIGSVGILYSATLNQQNIKQIILQSPIASAFKTIGFKCSLNPLCDGLINTGILNKINVPCAIIVGNLDRTAQITDNANILWNDIIHSNEDNKVEHFRQDGMIIQTCGQNIYFVIEGGDHNNLDMIYYQQMQQILKYLIKNILK